MVWTRPLVHMPTGAPAIYTHISFLDDDDGETSAKLPKLNEEDYKETEKSWIDNYQPYESMFEEPDQTSSSAAVGNNPTSSNSLPPPPDPLADRYDTSVPPPPVPVPALPDPALAAVLAAKAMIESQLPPPSATPGMYFLEVFWAFLGNFGYFLALSATFWQLLIESYQRYQTLPWQQF